MELVPIVIGVVIPKRNIGENYPMGGFGVSILTEYLKQNLRENFFQFYSLILIKKFSINLEFRTEFYKQNVELST